MIDMKQKRYKAFSLAELLIVLVIMGILVIIALPNLMPLITKAKSMEAQQQLAFLHSLQQSHFYTHSVYSESLEDLGFDQQTLVTNGGTANYLIEIIEVSENGFIARAIAVVDFDKDGTYNEWQVDQDKRIVERIKD